MSNSFIEYMKIHLISLEQDSAHLQNLLDNFQGDYDSDEYRELEIEDIRNGGELYATQHLIKVAEEMLA
jgi:hypothetical protein